MLIISQLNFSGGKDMPFVLLKQHKIILLFIFQHLLLICRVNFTIAYISQSNGFCVFYICFLSIPCLKCRKDSNRKSQIIIGYDMIF